MTRAARRRLEANRARLASCAGLHDFRVLDTPAGKLSERHACALCGGEASREAVLWYRRGVGDVTRSLLAEVGDGPTEKSLPDAPGWWIVATDGDCQATSRLVAVHRDVLGYLVADEDLPLTSWDASDRLCFGPIALPWEKP